MQNLKLLLCLTLIFSLTNCASFFSFENKEIEITTIPPDAYVYVDGWIIKTPQKVVIGNNRSNVIIVKKDGYKTKEVTPDIGIKYKEVFGYNLIWTLAYPFAVAFDFITGGAFGVADTKIILEESK